jgi:hypothetical protein
LGLTPEKFEALCANVMTDLPMIEELFDGSESRLKAHYPR